MQDVTTPTLNKGLLFSFGLAHRLNMYFSAIPVEFTPQQPRGKPIKLEHTNQARTHIFSPGQGRLWAPVIVRTLNTACPVPMAFT